MTKPLALVTGGAHRLGKAFAITLARMGYDLLLHYNSAKEQAQQTKSEIESLGVKCIGIQCDASNLAETQAAIDKAVAAFGSIDAVVNNAGITMDNLLLRMSEEQWDEVIRVNLKSVFNITKAAIKIMMKQKFGSIIHISSVVGVKGNAGQANYAASKAGMIGFSKSVALELGSRNIRSNAVAPGFIATEMTDSLDQKIVDGWIQNIPLKRAGTVQDVADVCVFLGSDMSTYITGQVLSVDGGMST